MSFTKKNCPLQSCPWSGLLPTCHLRSHLSFITGQDEYNPSEEHAERNGAQRNDEGHVADPHWPRDLRLHVLKEFRVDLQDGCSVAILRELLHFEILAELLGQNGHLLLLNQLSNVRREVVHDRAAGSAYGQLSVAPPTLLVRSTLGTVSRLWRRACQG